MSLPSLTIPQTLNHRLLLDNQGLPQKSYFHLLFNILSGVRELEAKLLSSLPFLSSLATLDLSVEIYLKMRAVTIIVVFLASALTQAGPLVQRQSRELGGSSPGIVGGAGKSPALTNGKANAGAFGRSIDIFERDAFEDSEAASNTDGFDVRDSGKASAGAFGGSVGKRINTLHGKATVDVVGGGDAPILTTGKASAGAFGGGFKKRTDTEGKTITNAGGGNGPVVQSRQSSGGARAGSFGGSTRVRPTIVEDVEEEPITDDEAVANTDDFDTTPQAVTEVVAVVQTEETIDAADSRIAALAARPSADDDANGDLPAPTVGGDTSAGVTARMAAIETALARLSDVLVARQSVRGGGGNSGGRSAGGSGSGGGRSVHVVDICTPAAAQVPAAAPTEPAQVQEVLVARQNRVGGGGRGRVHAANGPLVAAQVAAAPTRPARIEDALVARQTKNGGGGGGSHVVNGRSAVVVIDEAAVTARMAAIETALARVERALVSRSSVHAAVVDEETIETPAAQVNGNLVARQSQLGGGGGSAVVQEETFETPAAQVGDDVVACQNRAGGVGSAVAQVEAIETPAVQVLDDEYFEGMSDEPTDSGITEVSSEDGSGSLSRRSLQPLLADEGLESQEVVAAFHLDSRAIVEPLVARQTGAPNHEVTIAPRATAAPAHNARYASAIEAIRAASESALSSIEARSSALVAELMARESAAAYVEARGSREVQA